MHYRWIWVCAAVALGACAAIDLDRPLTPDEIGRLRKVAVVSLLPDTAQFIALGPEVLDNRSYTAPVPDWRMAEAAQDQLLLLLRERWRFETALLNHPGVDIAQLRADHAQLLWELAAAQGFDTVVSVWPSVSENFFFFKPGYGLFDRTLLGRHDHCLFAAYTVEVYDVATRRRLAWEWGGAAPCDLERGSGTDVPFKPRFDDYTADEKRRMQEAISTRFAITLRYALVKLGLGSPLRPTPTPPGR